LACKSATNGRTFARGPEIISSPSNASFRQIFT
jgi:hypothetical protein